MAGKSNEKFQDAEQEDFEHVKRKPNPNKLLRQYASLQSELDLDFEVWTAVEGSVKWRYEKKKKLNKRLDEIEGSCWSDYAENIISYAINEGGYYILAQLLKYGLERARACTTSRKLVLNYFIVENCGISRINRKRLGHTPSEQTSWIEINFALVDAIVLLCILSDKIEVRFQKYFPVPHDSKPFIIDLSDQRILRLYGKGQFGCIKLDDFDEALAAFLDCLSQLNAGIKKITPDENIPHEINKDKLKDPKTNRQYTVKLRKSTNLVYWSRAMRYLLNNMQFLSKWVHKNRHEPSERSSFEVLLEECSKRFSDL